MSWIPFTCIWIIELMVLVTVIGLLIETVVTNSKNLQVITQEMCTSSEKVQLLLEKIDHEFELINNCAKLIKIVFLSVGKFYKEIAAGSTTIEEAVREAKNSIPYDLRPHMSSLFNIPLEEKTSNVGVQQRPSEYHGPELRKLSATFNTLPIFQDVSTREIILGDDDIENIINSLSEVPEQGCQVLKMPTEVQA